MTTTYLDAHTRLVELIGDLADEPFLSDSEPPVDGEIIDEIIVFAEHCQQLASGLPSRWPVQYGHSSPVLLADVNEFLDSHRQQNSPGGFRRWTLPDFTVSTLMAMWRLLTDDMVSFDAAMFARLLDIIGNVCHGVDEAPTPHAHITVNSRDCDGPLDRFSTVILRDRHHPDGRFDAHDLVRSMIDVHESFEFTVHNDRGPNPYTAEWGHRTEEGFVHYHVAECEGPCWDERDSQRDHFAEAAGY